MARPSRRVRRRQHQKLTSRISDLRAEDTARKASKAIARLKTVLLGNYAKLTATSARLSAENVASLQATSPGLLDGKIVVKGFRLEKQRGFTLSKGERLLIGLKQLTLVATLEAAYSLAYAEDYANPDMDTRKQWILVEGFHWIRYCGYEPYVYGENRSRSVRAQNSGSGKPKRKLKQPRWYGSEDKAEVDYRLVERTAKGKLFQETGKVAGKHLRDKS